MSFTPENQRRVSPPGASALAGAHQQVPQGHHSGGDEQGDADVWVRVRDVSRERSDEEKDKDAQIEGTVHRVTAELTEGVTMTSAAASFRARCRTLLRRRSTDFRVVPSRCAICS